MILARIGGWRAVTLLFFDDQQNAYDRTISARWFGFKHLVFEDNYPAKFGDCYSLKKAFMQSGFRPYPAVPSLAASLRLKARRLVRKFLGIPPHKYGEIEPNSLDANYLRQNLDIYYEFPPVVKLERTRGNDVWSDEDYPTPEPLLKKIEHPRHRIFLDEAADYVWMCYTRLK